ncbi:pilus assembly protein [Sulfitobacter albidus]|uniref:Pilus assembly protein n=1 Tax=Sulfitobacter albidus TaxID=2829501 RepID=A0A975JED3_9RHOB|nr:TadE/TadG family type IV pilus assembly protein [Sulfitobacter albidus]QUJ76706.1 pilus assembly protein [Sulfitobacter albidus]
MKRRPLMRFCRDQDGAALVEFGLLFPIFMLMLGMTVEGARTYLAYQTTVSGVRDATRFISRVADVDTCTTGAGLSGWNDRLALIVAADAGGRSLMPVAVQVEDVTATLSCPANGLRGGATPLATVTATLRIQYPFSGLMRLAGVRTDTLTTTVSDQTRILGS